MNLREQQGLGSSESDEILATFRSRQWAPVEEEPRSWLLGIVVVAGCLGAAYLALRPAEKAPEPIAVSEPATEAAPVNRPMQLPTMRPDRNVRSVPRASTQVGQAGVYECRQNGQRVLSDRPCGPDAVERVIDTGGLNTFTEVAPPPVVIQPAPRQAAQTGVAMQQSSQPVQPSNAQQCEAIQAWIDRINARMRQKYTSWEGERLRADWHRAKEAYYDADCGR